MKLAIEESVLRQALEYMGRTIPPGPSASRQGLDAITALRTALEAAEKVEPVVRVWVGKVEGTDCRGVEFADMPEESAWNWMRLADGEHDLYTHPAPAVPEVESLRQQLADKHQLFMCASANYDRLAEHLVFANDQITELQRERDELVAALNQFAECDLNESNCANLEVATRRIRAVANAALAKLGADKTGEK